MDSEKTEQPTAESPRKAKHGNQADLPPEDLAAPDIDPATSAAEEDEDGRLP